MYKASLIRLLLEEMKLVDDMCFDDRIRFYELLDLLIYRKELSVEFFNSAYYYSLIDEYKSRYTNPWSMLTKDIVDKSNGFLYMISDESIEDCGLCQQSRIGLTREAYLRICKYAPQMGIKQNIIQRLPSAPLTT